MPPEIKLMPEIEKRLSLANSNLQKAARILLSQGIEDVQNCCLPLSLCFLRPDLMPPEILARALVNPEHNPGGLIRILGRDDLFIPARFKQSTKLTDVLIRTRVVAGVIAYVPRSFLGAPGTQRKGVITAKDSAHAIALLGTLRRVDPDNYRFERFRNPKRFSKNERRGLLALIDPGRDSSFLCVTPHDLISEMVRIPKANALIVLSPNCRIEWAENKRESRIVGVR